MVQQAMQERRDHYDNNGKKSQAAEDSVNGGKDLPGGSVNYVYRSLTVIRN
jgi:hypothetical protein